MGLGSLARRTGRNLIKNELGETSGGGGGSGGRRIFYGENYGVRDVVI